MDDASVSRQHAAFVNSSSATFLVLVDLKSAQGSFVGDERVTPVPKLGIEAAPGRPMQLDEGQTIRFGSSAIVFKVSGVELAQPERWAIPAWCTLPSFAVRLSGGPRENTFRKDLSDVKGVVVGRSEERTDIAVPDGSVSRLHAAIVHDEETTFVVGSWFGPRHFCRFRTHRAEYILQGD